MRITKPSCADIITSAWSSSSLDDAVHNVLGTVEMCTAQLVKLNSKTFGNMGKEISKLELQLKCAWDVTTRHELLSKIREWRNKEEIMRWQRARSDYLKHGDSNT